MVVRVGKISISISRKKGKYRGNIVSNEKAGIAKISFGRKETCASRENTRDHPEPITSYSSENLLSAGRTTGQIRKRKYQRNHCLTVP